MPANSIFSGPVSNNSTFNIVLTEIFSNGKARTKKAYGFQILHYYRSFSSDIVAVKGLIKLFKPKAIYELSPHSELRSCVSENRGGRRVFPVPHSLYGVCGRKATLNLNTWQSELRSCVKVEVAVLGSPSLIDLMVSVDVKQHWTGIISLQRLGAVWKSRWPSWAPRP